MFNKGPNYANATARIADQARVAEGLVVVELDTGNIYLRTLTDWLKIGNAGVAYVYQNGGVSDYGPPREDAYLDINAATVGQTAIDVFVSNDISIYDSLAFEVFLLSGGTPSLRAFASFDGITFSTLGLAITDLASGALGTAIVGGTGITALGNYIVAIPAKARRMKLAYTAGTIGDCSIRGGFWKR